MQNKKHNNDSNNIDVDIWRCRHLRLSTSSLSIRSLRCHCHFCSHFSLCLWLYLQILSLPPARTLPSLTFWVFYLLLQHHFFTQKRRATRFVYSSKFDPNIPCIESKSEKHIEHPEIIFMFILRYVFVSSMNSVVPIETEIRFCSLHKQHVV